MDYYGYAGKTLYVDLESCSTRVVPLDLDEARKFVGGAGLTSKLAFDLIKPGASPLSPENLIILGVGPLVGTMVPTACKTNLTMKFPGPASRSESKYIVDISVAGGKRFGIMLKNAGYDVVVITGRARKPSHLKIIDDDVQVCDAADLRGKTDIFETTDELSSRHKGPTGKAGAMAIGKAGENLVNGAIAFVDNMSTIGTFGGAVFGSKNLKAVVTLGSKGVKVADGKKLMALAEKLRQEIITHPGFGKGRPAGYLRSTSAGYPDDLTSRTKVGRVACASCPDPCKADHEIKDGKFAGTKLLDCRAHYAFYHGRRLRLEEYGEILMLFDLATRAGLDMFTAVRMLHFVSRLYERGIISSKDTGGLEIKRGDFNSYRKLLEQYINRQHIGEYMAQGWYALSDKVGVDAASDWMDGASIVRNFDTITDARFDGFDPGHGLAAILRPRGQLLLQDTMYPAGEDIHKETCFPEWKRSLNDVKRDCVEMGAPPEAMDRIFTGNGFNAGRLEKHAEDAYAVYDCLGVCSEGGRTTWEPVRNVPLLAEMYTAATGFDITTQELKKRGERVWNLQKLLNVREGFTRKDDEIPALWLKNTETPLKLKGGEKYLVDWFGRRVSTADIQRMLDDYYDERGWDIEKGVPTRDKLFELGLERFSS